MKKLLLILVVSIFSIFILYKIGSWTGILRVHTIAMFSNEPTLKPDDWVVSSNIFNPKKFEFVIYEPKNIERSYGNWIHRICGVGNDTVQIKDGTLYVNGYNLDKELKLKHSYLVDLDKFPELKKEINIQEHNYFMFNKDFLIVHLTLKQAQKINNLKRYFKKGVDKDIYRVYKEDWNEDNFGPLIIPEGYFFVLGDNRNNSIDSRFQGLIPRERLIRKIILK